MGLGTSSGCRKEEKGHVFQFSLSPLGSVGWAELSKSPTSERASQVFLLRGCPLLQPVMISLVQYLNRLLPLSVRS